MMTAFRTLFLILTVLATAGIAHAQERSTVKKVDAAATPASDFSADVRNNVQSTASKLKQPCGTHAHGDEWGEACDIGLTGTITRICVHGESVIKSVSCQRDPTNCGAHLNGDTWTGSCGGSLLGDITYKCQSGNTVIDSSSCTLPYSCSDGSSYNVSCPSGMTGTITYTCSSNSLLMSGSNCQTIQADCGGGHASGSSWSASCPNGLSGNVTYTCLNGSSAITAINCSEAPASACGGQPAGSTWDVSCPSPYSGTLTYKCFNGTTAISKMSCAAITFDSTQGINRTQVIAAAKSYAGYPAGLSITGVAPDQTAANVICATALGSTYYALDGAWGLFKFNTADNETILYWNGTTFISANAKDTFGSNKEYFDSITCARNKSVQFTN